ncbi:putative ankyrin repeat protein RF_0381 [Liolophura sinensis]|uniref:putative ankyrin repeat protein RF_0381 n=1 Tax=Liolophura sinensis TaxID=3198878 RepID=UPI0031591A93
MAGAETSKQDRTFVNSLRTAVSAGDVKTVRRLVKGGVDVNTRYWFYGTLLHEAVFSGSADIISLLIQAKVDVNATNKDGRTALHLAARSGNEEICALLLKSGANTNLLSSDGRSCLHVAAWKCNIGICSQLIEAGCHINQRDADGWTPLFWAVKSGSMVLTRLLVENGARLDVEDNKRLDPLITALISKNKSMVSYLLREGADQRRPSQNSIDRKRMLDFIRQSDIKDKHLIRLLLQRAGLSIFTKGDGRLTFDEELINYRVSTLQTFCRSVIRGKLCTVRRGCSITSSILQLPLPGHVKDFVRLSELLEDR